MRKCSAGLYLLAVLAVTGLVIPITGAAGPGQEQQKGSIVTAPDLNGTGTGVSNLSVPARYQVTPTPIRVEVEIADTAIPAPKGEMQAGPRSIGVTISPATLVILTLAIAVVAAGAWYILRRKPDEEENEE